MEITRSDEVSVTADALSHLRDQTPIPRTSSLGCQKVRHREAPVTVVYFLPSLIIYVVRFTVNANKILGNAAFI